MAMSIKRKMQARGKGKNENRNDGKLKQSGREQNGALRNKDEIENDENGRKVPG
jgi:hypothetical protein